MTKIEPLTDTELNQLGDELIDYILNKKPIDLPGSPHDGDWFYIDGCGRMFWNWKSRLSPLMYLSKSKGNLFYDRFFATSTGSQYQQLERVLHTTPIRKFKNNQREAYLQKAANVKMEIETLNQKVKDLEFQLEQANIRRNNLKKLLIDSES